VGLHLSLFVLAQNKSNKGKEFWLGYGHNVLFTAEAPGNTQNQVVYLSAEAAATVTVSIPATGWSQTVNIPANTVDASISIPKTGVNDARLTAEGLFNKGIHVQSDMPIVAYTHQYGLVSSAATMLMPVETFGYTYYSLNFTQISNYPDCYSWFYVVASEDNTTIQITPSDTTQGGWLKNQTYEVNLNRGQVYNVFGKKTGTYTGKDLTGSKIVSVNGADGKCHPIAVFSGSSRNVVCDGNGGEFMQQQIFPAIAWGTRYATYHITNGINNPVFTPFLNHYRILVRDAATVVKRNGIILSGLINNCYYEFSSNSGDYIESDKPILVAQYTVNSNECVANNNTITGDPEMIYLSPIEQGVKSAIFYTTRNQAIDYNFVSIIVPTQAIHSLKVDGVAVGSADYITHPNNNQYTVAVKRILGAAAQHAVTADAPFIATVYGSGNYESYGYNVGTMINNLNAYGTIKNTLNSSGGIDSFTCPKTPFRLFVQLGYKATSITWKLSAAIPSINPGADVVVVNPVPFDSTFINGRKYYAYTLQQDLMANSVGDYAIPVVYNSPDIDGCNQTESFALSFAVKSNPIADFSTLGAACLKQSLQFNGTVNAAGFGIKGYRWDFPDNSFDTTIATVKSFNISGNQSVRFRAFATNGCIADTTKPVVIQPLPLANFSIVNQACENETITLTDSSTISMGSINAWHWNFGDGTVLNSTTNQNISHQFTQPGNYQIALHTTSAANCKSDTISKPITIVAKPQALFDVSGKPCIGDSLLLTDLSSVANGNITSRNWTIGNGQRLTKNNGAPFYYSFANSGNLNISLTVQSDNGCSSNSTDKAVVIHPLPIVDAGSDKIIIAGSNATLDASLQNASAHNITWSPVQFLSNPNILRPTASPTSNINYFLSVTNKISGCTLIDSVYIRVVNKLQVPNAFSPNGDGINDTWKIPGIEAYPKAVVSIFNRSGQQIFVSNNYATAPFAGLFKQRPLSAGVYYYIIQLNNDSGERLTGSLMLLQ